MGKAITGAAEIAGAIGMGALAFFQPELIALPGYAQAMYGLGMAGISSEAAAVASALTSNRGQNITTRQAASFRQLVYGQQRIGGVMIWRSTTGNHHDQMNMIIVLATHELWAVTDLYLDGRKVYFTGSGTGHFVRNGYGFGGFSDGNDHVGPDGSTYNFGDRGHGPMVYAEVRYGDQVATDVPGAITANDPNWGPNGLQTPAVMGCAYMYLKLEDDQSVFPSEPEVRVAVMGKPVYDPRTGTTAYSHNPALIINDILQDPDYGIDDNSVNQAQLIAAANICEEQVTCVAGQEERYAAHWHYDTSTEPGDAIDTFLAAMGGRMARIGGEWHIFPATWSAPALSLGADHLRGPVRWSQKRAGKDKFNRVAGVYTAPNYPYNVAGNLYDQNGWYNGTIQNNTGFAFQPTNYPMYACDHEHGYPSDQWLNEDGGKKLSKELGFPAVLSVSQAQRLAKIALLRNRMQGTGQLEMSLHAFQLQPCDTFWMSFAGEGWTDKVLEVSGFQFRVVQQQGSGPLIRISLTVNETDPSVYAWNPSEELTIYDTPVMSQIPFTVTPPTNMELVSSAATALLQPDGSTVPRIEVTWDTPLDIRVSKIQVQYRVTTTSTWLPSPDVDVSLNAAYISPVISGQMYDVRIRSMRSNGATSAWVEIDGFQTGLVLNIATQDGVGRGSLIGEAFPDGTAGIVCQPFTAQVGNRALSMFPAGPVTLPGLAQQTLYYVYYVDSSYTGGNVTPVATVNKGDFLGKLGYFLIDSIVTPYASPSGQTSRYYPSTSTTFGNRTVQSEGDAYDGNLQTSAYVSSSAVQSTIKTAYSVCTCTWSGFPSVITGAAATLTVIAEAELTTGGTAAISASINGNDTDLTTSPNMGQSTYTLTVPAGTNLSTVTVTVNTKAQTSGQGDAEQAGVNVYEIYVE